MSFLELYIFHKWLFAYVTHHLHSDHGKTWKQQLTQMCAWAHNHTKQSRHKQSLWYTIHFFHTDRKSNRTRSLGIGHTNTGTSDLAQAESEKNHLQSCLSDLQHLHWHWHKQNQKRITYSHVSLTYNICTDTGTSRIRKESLIVMSLWLTTFALTLAQAIPDDYSNLPSVPFKEVYKNF